MADNDQMKLLELLAVMSNAIPYYLASKLQVGLQHWHLLPQFPFLERSVLQLQGL